MWYPCDDPVESLSCCCCWAARACSREFCCALGASAAATERVKKAASRQQGQGDTTDGCGCVRALPCCAIPVGRTAHFFDLDIVADIRAKQSCWQLCLNEGSLHFGRLPGGDASHDSRAHTFFNVKYVPEVFAYFDEVPPARSHRPQPVPQLTDSCHDHTPSHICAARAPCPLGPAAPALRTVGIAHRRGRAGARHLSHDTRVAFAALV